MGFPNKAGDHEDTDDILRAELKAAGIPTLQEAEGKPPEYFADFLRKRSGSVKTSVLGVLYGWEFTRAWYYWIAKGPGIDVETAEALHATHGRDVRVDGHCGCPSPREAYKGLACGNYHVDTPEGLKALADTIKGLVNKSKGIPVPDKVVVDADKVWNALVEDHIEWYLGVDVFSDEEPVDKDEKFMTKASRLLPEDFITKKVEEIYERGAERIYNTWKNAGGWTPWVPRGNSIQQDEARGFAKSTFLVHLFNEENDA